MREGGTIFICLSEKTLICPVLLVRRPEGESQCTFSPFDSFEKYLFPFYLG